jgi:hypothetical protein
MDLCRCSIDEFAGYSSPDSEIYDGEYFVLGNIHMLFNVSADKGSACRHQHFSLCSVASDLF